MKANTAELNTIAPPILDPAALGYNKSAPTGSSSSNFLDKLSSMIQPSESKSTAENGARNRSHATSIQNSTRLKNQQNALKRSQDEQATQEARKQKEATTATMHANSTEAIQPTNVTKKAGPVLSKKSPADTSMEKKAQKTNAPQGKEELNSRSDVTQNASDNKKEGAALLKRLATSSAMLSGKELPISKEVASLSEEQLSQLNALAQKLLEGDSEDLIDSSTDEDSLKQLQLLQLLSLQAPEKLQLTEKQTETLNIKLVKMDVMPQEDDQATKMKLANLLAASSLGLSKHAESLQGSSATTSLNDFSQTMNGQSHLGLPQQGQSSQMAQLMTAATAQQSTNLDPSLMAQQLASMQGGKVDPKLVGATGGTAALVAATSATSNGPTNPAEQNGATGPLAATLNQLHETQQQKDVQAASSPLHFTKATAADAVSERIQMMMSKNLKNIDIRLDPPELGKMQIKLSMEHGQTSIQFLVHNAQAKDMLEASLPRLRELFESQGMALADTHVDQQSDNSAGTGEQLAENANGSSNGRNPSSLETEEEGLNQSIKITPQEDGINYYA